MYVYSNPKSITIYAAKGAKPNWETYRKSL